MKCDERHCRKAVPQEKMNPNNAPPQVGDGGEVHGPDRGVAGADEPRCEETLSFPGRFIVLDGDDQCLFDPQRGGALHMEAVQFPTNTFTHTNSRSHCGGLPGSKKIFGLAVGRFVVVPPSNARPFLPSGSWLVKLQEQAKQEQAEQELRSPNMTDLHSPTAEIKPSFAALRAGAEASSM